jgi:hypothetical protein
MEEGWDGGVRKAMGRRSRSAPTFGLRHLSGHTTTQPSSIEEEGGDRTPPLDADPSYGNA